MKRSINVTTKIDAMRLGLQEKDKWFKKYLYPKIGEKPILVKETEYYSREQCEEICSKTELSRRKLKITAEVKPIGKLCVYCSSRWTWFYVYRISDAIPKRKVKVNDSKEIDLLSAIFVVNKTAKRYRDSGTAYYHQRMHGFAAVSKDKKLHLYGLKDRGLKKAYIEGLLEFCGFNHGMALYRGGGYCFHSFTYPTEFSNKLSEMDLNETIKIPSSEKGVKESRLKDAVLTLEKICLSNNELKRFNRIDRNKESLSLEDDYDD